MNKHVVLLDDDKYGAEGFKDILDIEGISCDLYFKADEFMKHIDDLDKYDVVFIDIMLRKGHINIKDPTMETGEYIFDKVRSHYPEKVICVVSAKNISEIKIDFDKDFNIYIGKPLNKKRRAIVRVIDEV